MKKHIQALSALATLSAAVGLWPTLALAQNFPITAGEKATAQQVAQAGVPLSELAPTAPDSYTVKAGDTLWAISGLYLTSPWRWPELWGMNLQEIRNPHRIYPGQKLFLLKQNGRALLSTSPPAADPSSDLVTVHVSPHTRYESLAESSLPALKSSLIEPFLAEPLIVDNEQFERSPRIVATQEFQVLLTRGDRAYARSSDNSLLLAKDKPVNYRVFRDATPLKDPDTGAILGYEAQYLGKAQLVRGESSVANGGDKDKAPTVIPATIEILNAKEEIRVGDRLLPEPPREFLSYTPHAPNGGFTGRVISVYGSTAVANATQNQVVVINRGTRDGVTSGEVLAILKDGATMVDKTDAAQTRIKLPDERNGLMMVFRPFEKVSYALILQISQPVSIGDRLISPR